MWSMFHSRKNGLSALFSWVEIWHPLIDNYCSPFYGSIKLSSRLDLRKCPESLSYYGTPAGRGPSLLAGHPEEVPYEPRENAAANAEV